MGFTRGSVALLITIVELISVHCEFILQNRIKRNSLPFFTILQTTLRLCRTIHLFTSLFYTTYKTNRSNFVTLYHQKYSIFTMFYDLLTQNIFNFVINKFIVLKMKFVVINSYIYHQNLDKFSTDMKSIFKNDKVKAIELHITILLCPLILYVLYIDQNNYLYINYIRFNV